MKIRKEITEQGAVAVLSEAKEPLTTARICDFAEARRRKIRTKHVAHMRRLRFENGIEGE